MIAFLHCSLGNEVEAQDFLWDLITDNKQTKIPSNGINIIDNYVDKNVNNK